MSSRHIRSHAEPHDFGGRRLSHISGTQNDLLFRSWRDGPNNIGLGISAEVTKQVRTADSSVRGREKDWERWKTSTRHDLDARAVEYGQGARTNAQLNIKIDQLNNRVMEVTKLLEDEKRKVASTQKLCEEKATEIEALRKNLADVTISLQEAQANAKLEREKAKDASTDLDKERHKAKKLYEFTSKRLQEARDKSASGRELTERLNQENSTLSKRLEKERAKSNELREENGKLQDEALAFTKLLEQEKVKSASDRKLAEQKESEINILTTRLADSENSVQEARTQADREREMAEDKGSVLDDLRVRLQYAEKTRDLEKRNIEAAREAIENLKKTNEELCQQLANEANVRTWQTAIIEKNTPHADGTSNDAQSEQQTGDSSIGKTAVKIESDLDNELCKSQLEKMREGVSRLSDFTRDVLAGLSNPLLGLEALRDMFDDKSAVRGRRKLEFMEREMRDITREASRLHTVAKTVLHDPDTVDWNTEI